MLFLSHHSCLQSCNVTEKLCPHRRVQSEPILRPEHPWETFGVFYQGNVLKDGDTFRMWYSAVGEERREQQYLGYAESDDGVTWRRVLRREWGFGEWEETNILYGQNFNIAAPHVGLYHEPRDGYKYFCAFDSRIEQHQNQHVVRKPAYARPGDRERLMRHPNYTPPFDWNKYFGQPSWRATYIADSKDGFNWEPADARFAIPGQADGDHTTVYDPQAKLYRMYFRDNRLDENGQRIRQVMTSSSADLVEWSEPQLCLESDAIDEPRENQIHGMTVTYHDGVFIGLVQILEIEEAVPTWNPLLPMERGRFHVELAVSYDGVHFHRIADRQEYFGTGEPGAWDGGMVRSGGQWVFDGERMLMYYDGRAYKHERKAGEPAGLGIGVAQSPRDRFAGLTPRDSSRPAYIVVEVPADMSTPALNCEVSRGARISCSLRRPDGCRVLSFTDDEFEAIGEGGLCQPLRWANQRQLPAGDWHLRIKLEGEAVVYALNAIGTPR